MYKPKYFRWKMMHVSSILAHLGLICAGSVSFVYHNVAESQFPSMRQSKNTGFRIITADEEWEDRVNGMREWASLDLAVVTLLATCIFVGVFGLAINAIIFRLLLAVESHEVTLTEGQQHWRKQIVTFFSCIFNIILAAAGVGLVDLLAANVTEFKSLIAPLILAFFQAPLALSTAVFDAVKNYREGKDLLD